MLMSLADRDIGLTLVRAVADALGDALRIGPFDATANLMRFLGDLVAAQVVDPNAFLDTASEMVNRIHDGDRRVADYFVHAALVGLLHAGKALSVSQRDRLELIVNTAAEYCSQRSFDDDTLGLRVLNADEPYVDSLSVLGQQVAHLMHEQWECDFLPRTFSHFAEQISQSIPHPLDPVPLPVSPTAYPRPPPLLSIFGADLHEGPDFYPPPKSVERWIMQEAVRSIFNCCEANHHIAADWLKSLQFGVECHVEKAIAETLFREALARPRPHLPLIAYSRINTSLCAKFVSYPKYLAMAIKHLFFNIEQLDFDSIVRFVELFVLQLNNFDLLWNWSGWDSCLQADAAASSSKDDGSDRSPSPSEALRADKQRRFLKHAFLKLQRLNYHERIVRVVPIELHSLLPPAPKVSHPSTHLPEERHAALNEMIEAVKCRRSADEIAGSPSFSPELFFYAMLDAGQFTISHMMSLIERYSGLLSTLCGDGQSDNSVLLVNCIRTFWSLNSQVMEILVFKLLNYRLAKPNVVLQAALDNAQQMLLLNRIEYEHLLLIEQVLVHMESYVDYLNEQAGQAADESAAAEMAATAESTRDALKRSVESVLQLLSVSGEQDQAGASRGVAAMLSEFSSHITRRFME